MHIPRRLYSAGSQLSPGSRVTITSSAPKSPSSSARAKHLEARSLRYRSRPKGCGSSISTTPYSKTSGWSRTTTTTQTQSHPSGCVTTTCGPVSERCWSWNGATRRTLGCAERSAPCGYGSQRSGAWLFGPLIELVGRLQYEMRTTLMISYLQSRTSTNIIFSSSRTDWCGCVRLGPELFPAWVWMSAHSRHGVPRPLSYRDVSLMHIRRHVGRIGITVKMVVTLRTTRTTQMMREIKVVESKRTSGGWRPLRELTSTVTT